MANKKISQLTLAVDLIFPTDLMEVARDDGAGGYTSEAISGDYIYEGMMYASPYLYAYTSVNQTFLAATATAIDFKTIELQNYIDVPAPTKLEVQKMVILKLILRQQFSMMAAVLQLVIMLDFFKKNGATNVLKSSKFMTAPDNNHVKSYSTSWFVDLKGGDFIEIYCVMDKINFKLLTESAQTGVVTPSSSVIMSRIG